MYVLTSKHTTRVLKVFSARDVNEGSVSYLVTSKQLCAIIRKQTPSCTGQAKSVRATLQQLLPHTQNPSVTKKALCLLEILNEGSKNNNVK
jgi:acetolactate synthase small subunit